MALTFFWRCEGTTLDGTHDFTAGGNTATANNSPAISATAARIGSNGLLFDGVSERYDFNPASIWNRLVGSAAFSFQFPTALATTGQPFFLCRGSASFDDTIQVQIVSTNELRLIVRDATAGAVNLDTTSVDLAAGNWYGVVIRWDQPNNRRKIEVYNSSNALIQAVEDTSTAFTAPASLDASNGFRIGDSGGSVGTVWVDNVFVADTYGEPLENNLTITSYTGYSSGGSSVTKSPTTANLSLGGLSVITDAFRFVRIREVLINQFGQSVANATDIRLLVWYAGQATGPHDVSINGQTTDANGTASWSIPTGSLLNGQHIFYLAQNSVSFSTYTCARMVPSYES